MRVGSLLFTLVYFMNKKNFNQRIKQNKIDFDITKSNELNLISIELQFQTRKHKGAK